MSTFQPWHDYTPTINSAAHALFAICRQNYTDEQLTQWRENDAVPNDFMDADAILMDILFCHDVNMSDDALWVFLSNRVHNQASELNRQFITPYYG